ncbi:flavoprotein [Actinoallomurus soli]|uniref:flavoprotein n=1 Tax=Actinoallomurus soli TaxID=2952535 RepID=UPI0020934374|nr:flavoprotein [Actinoallomurus soli]MCO5971642.1 flavoprotein [Actinoallomurus soli]
MDDHDQTSPGMPALGPPPPFTADRLLLFGTGSLAAALLPFWINWFRNFYPEPDLRIVITRSAERFVSRGALAPLIGRDVPLDTWPEHPGADVPHVRYAEWPDAIVVYPATMHFIARFALGFTDTPMLSALQCTTAAIAVAPTLPPGGENNPVTQRHLKDLGDRPNIEVVPPVPGRSASSGRGGGNAAPPLPAVLDRLERLRSRIREDGRA